MGRIVTNQLDLSQYIDPATVQRGLQDSYTEDDEHLKNLIEEKLAEQGLTLADAMRPRKKRAVAGSRGPASDDEGGDEALGPVNDEGVDPSIAVAEGAPASSDSSMNDIMGALKRKLLTPKDESPALKAQAAGLAESEADLKRFKNVGPGYDFAPVKGALDTMLGTDMVKSIPGTGSIDDYGLTRAKLNDIIQKERMGLTEARAKEMADQVGLKLLDATTRQYRADQKLREGQTSTIDKAVNKNVFGVGSAGAANFVQTENAYANMSSMLASRKLVGFSAMASLFARNIGQEKGALSEGDVGRAQPATIAKLGAQIEAFFTNNPGAEVPASLTKPFADIINTVRKNYGKTMLNQLKSEWDAFRTRPGYEEWMKPGQWGNQRFTSALDRIAKFGGLENKDLGEAGLLGNVAKGGVPSAAVDKKDATRATAAAPKKASGTAAQKKKRLDELRRKAAEAEDAAAE